MECKYLSQLGYTAFTAPIAILGSCHRRETPLFIVANKAYRHILLPCSNLVMAARRFSFRALLLLALVLLLSVAAVRASEDSGADADDDDNADLAAEIAREDAAAAEVGEEAEDEDDDESDAMNEEADQARYDPDRKHPLTDIPEPATDVQVGHVFQSGLPHDPSANIDHEADINDVSASPRIMTLGEPVKAVVAFSNQGRMAYHVWGITGSLNFHNRFSVFVQNFSYTMVNRSVAAGDELSFSYSFIPNERLDVRPFQLALTMFYESQSSRGNAIRGHATTFYNATVTAKPGTQTISNSLFMIIFGLVVAAVVGAWFAWKSMDAAKKEAKKEASESSTVETSKNEWLEEHHNMVKAASGSRAPRQRTNAKK